MPSSNFVPQNFMEVTTFVLILVNPPLFEVDTVPTRKVGYPQVISLEYHHFKQMEQSHIQNSVNKNKNTSEQPSWFTTFTSCWQDLECTFTNATHYNVIKSSPHNLSR